MLLQGIEASQDLRRSRFILQPHKTEEIRELVQVQRYPGVFQDLEFDAVTPGLFLVQGQTVLSKTRGEGVRGRPEKGIGSLAIS
jgi:hypothetical protein